MREVGKIAALSIIDEYSEDVVTEPSGNVVVGVICDTGSCTRNGEIIPSSITITERGIAGSRLGHPIDITDRPVSFCTNGIDVVAQNSVECGIWFAVMPGDNNGTRSTATGYMNENIAMTRKLRTQLPKNRDLVKKIHEYGLQTI